MKAKQAKETSKEKKNKFLSLFPVPFIIAYVFDLVYGFFFYRSYQAVNFYDTSSYFVAAGNILSGKADLLRLPVYPLFLRFCEVVGKDHVNRFCVTIQMVIFYISIYFFYKTIERFTSNKVMPALATVFYGCMSSITCFNSYMLTESLTISGTVFFAYLMVLFAQKKKQIYLTVSILLALVLVMIRPSMLFLLVVTGIAVLPLIYGLIKKKTSKWAIMPVVTLFLCVAALFGYMAKNKKDNGYFGLSYVSEMNRFYDVVQADIWHNNSDTEITGYIQSKFDENYAPLGAAIATEEAFRNTEEERARIIAFNKEAISNNRGAYMYYLLKKTLLMGNTKTQYNLTNNSDFLTETANRDTIWFGDYLDFNVNFVYLICLLSFAIVIGVFCKKKKLLKGELILALMIAGQLGVNILAGPAEFHRLNIICYPLAILLLAVFLGLAVEKLENNLAEKE